VCITGAKQPRREGGSGVNDLAKHMRQASALGAPWRPAATAGVLCVGESWASIGTGGCEWLVTLISGANWAGVVGEFTWGAEPHLSRPKP